MQSLNGTCSPVGLWDCAVRAARAEDALREVREESSRSAGGRNADGQIDRVMDWQLDGSVSTDPTTNHAPESKYQTEPIKIVLDDTARN
jgi:hypothetical protein